MSAAILNERHSVHTLVQQHLHRTFTTIHPAIKPSAVRFSLACAGVGLDHTAAEQAMAFSDESVRGKFGEYFLFTDRRVLGCFGETRYDVRYGAIRDLKVESGILTRGIFVQHADGTKTALTMGALLQPAGAFFTDLMKLAPEQREPPPRPLCPASASDPTGARQAMEWLGVPDPRTSLMLRYLDAAASAGTMPVTLAQDFVARVVLHHRNLHYGRGMVQGRWVSPVSANDLANLMVTLFGNPLAHSEQPVRMLELPSSLRSNAVGKAALSSAIGLASMAVLGVGWVSTAKSPISKFRVMMADTAPFTSFRLQGPRGVGLERESPELLHQIDVKLLELEDEVLMRRLVRGWNEKTPDLLAIGGREILLQMATVAGAAIASVEEPRVVDDGSATPAPVGSAANVSAFVSDDPGGGLSMETAQKVQAVAQALIPAGPVSQQINAAARLMTSRKYEEAAAAYHAIAERHPERRGVCWSQIGAAVYFLGRFEEAIQWYEAALGAGEDPQMMRENIDEAREAIAKRR